MPKSFFYWRNIVSLKFKCFLAPAIDRVGLESLLERPSTSYAHYFTRNVKSTASFLDLSHPHQVSFTRRFVVTQPGLMAAVAVIWVKTTKSFFPPRTFSTCSLPSSCRRGVEILGTFLYVVVLCCSFTCYGFMNQKKTNILFTDGLKGMKDEGVVKYTRYCVCKERFLDSIFR